METADLVNKHIDELAGLFSDGFQVSDIFPAVEAAMEIVEQVGDLSGEQKQQLVVALIHKLIDVTDIWGPDAVIDPVLKTIVSHVVPGLIGSIVRASKGQVKVNEKS